MPLALAALIPTAKRLSRSFTVKFRCISIRDVALKGVKQKGCDQSAHLSNDQKKDIKRRNNKRQNELIHFIDKITND